ncbi:MAG: hypothetical protein ACI81P_002022, partial [Neolewinella sp.]
RAVATEVVFRDASGQKVKFWATKLTGWPTSLLLVDAQSVKLTPMIGANRGIDGGKWINGRKRSILTDTLGRIWRVEVHAVNVHDGRAGLDLIYPDFTTQMPRATKLLADSAYTGCLPT